LTGLSPVVLVGAALGVAVAATAGTVPLGLAAGDSADNTSTDANDNMIAAVAIDLMNFMVDCPSLFPFSF
jgi:hypothetical protein